MWRWPPSWKGFAGGSCRRSSRAAAAAGASLRARQTDRVQLRFLRVIQQGQDCILLRLGVVVRQVFRFLHVGQRARQRCALFWQSIGCRCRL